MTQATISDHRPRVAAQRREAMRGRLMRAALEIGAFEGPAAITIDSVIAKANVARGTFYKYFKTPDEVVRALSYEVSQSAIAYMHPEARAMKDPAERIAFGVRTTLEWVRHNPVMGAFFVRSGWPVLSDQHLFFVNVGASLEEGIASGRFASIPLELALSLVAGTTVGAIHELAQSERPPTFIQHTVEVILRGLGLPVREAKSLAAKAQAHSPDFERSVLGAIGSP